jgi:hypothetical protein
MSMDAPPYDAPPCDDDFAPLPDRGLENAVKVLAAQLGNLADSINHLAVASQAARTPPGAAKPPAGPPGPPMPTAGQGGPPAGVSGEKTTQQKMGAKVYAICKQNNWDIADVGQRATGRPIGADSRRWTVEELGAVLDAMKEWGFP